MGCIGWGAVWETQRGSRRVWGDQKPRSLRAAAAGRCRAQAGVPPGRTHLAPRAGPALGAPPPGSRRRARPQGAAASSWGWGGRSARTPHLSRTSAALEVRARRPPTPVPVLPAGPVRSAPPAPPPAAAESRSHSREKSLIPGGGARAGTQGPPPPTGPAVAAPGLPWTDARTPLAPRPEAPGNPRRFLHGQRGCPAAPSGGCRGGCSAHVRARGPGSSQAPGGWRQNDSPRPTGGQTALRDPAPTSCGVGGPLCRPPSP